MFGPCRHCRADCDGVTKELTPDGECPDCASRQKLTPGQIAFLTDPIKMYSNKAFFARGYTKHEIADLAEIQEGNREAFYQEIKTAERAGILEKGGSKSQDHIRFTAYTHRSVSKFLATVRPNLAARLVAAVFADQAIPFVCLHREWIAAFARSMGKLPPASSAETTVTIPADVARHFDETARIEFPSAEEIGPRERSTLISRLLMFRRMLIDIRRRFFVSGAVSYGPREPDPHFEMTAVQQLYESERSHSA